MPIDPVTLQLIPFTTAQVAAMAIDTFGVRDRSIAVESRRIDENVMTRPFFCKWSERYNFITHLLGDVKLYTDFTDPMSPVTKLSRLLPDSALGRHPVHAQIAATHIEDIRPHPLPVDDSNKFPDAAEAMVTVAYAQARWEMKNDAFIESVGSEKWRYTSRTPTSQAEAEAFTLPGACFKYTKFGGGAPHGVPVPFNVSFVRPVVRFGITWHLLPNELYMDPTGALFRRLYVGTGDGIPWIGTVNKQDLLLPGLGTWPAGKLLLEGIDDRAILSPLGASDYATGMRWDVTFKFAYTPRGWLDLFFFDPVTPANSDYYRVSNDGAFYTVAAMPDKTGLYNVRDHVELWNPHLA